jgi:hypothetical protein
LGAVAHPAIRKRAAGKKAAREKDRVVIDNIFSSMTGTAHNYNF